MRLPPAIVNNTEEVLREILRLPVLLTLPYRATSATIRSWARVSVA